MQAVPCKRKQYVKPVVKRNRIDEKPKACGLLEQIRLLLHLFAMDAMGYRSDFGNTVPLLKVQSQVSDGSRSTLAIPYAVLFEASSVFAHHQTSSMRSGHLSSLENKGISQWLQRKGDDMRSSISLRHLRRQSAITNDNIRSYVTYADSPHTINQLFCIVTFLRTRMRGYFESAPVPPHTITSSVTL
ncbi:hypothetical protein TNCV_2605291 [Trichonephila clavipes]|nr:hypothetical protein TNCV_2605291 [Trichonephila clavipes]